MEKKHAWPELVLSSNNSKESQSITRAVKKGHLRKIGPKIYTSNFVDEPETILKRHRYQILGHLFPGAVISHRSALEGGISQEGEIVLTFKYTKKISLPGLTVHLIEGPGRDEADTPFLHQLYISSRGRAFLENMVPSRSRQGFNKSLSKKDLEERLDRLMRIYGIEEPNVLRDQARAVAQRLHFEKEYAQLEKIIGALLGTQSDNNLQTDVGISRAKGEPYDPYRIELFATLASYLQQEALPPLKSSLTTPQARVNEAFFESYFSNYIEGTEFAIEEAEKIIFENTIDSNRPEDSHDILSTYQIVSNAQWMNSVPLSAEELISLLMQRHEVLMAARKDKLPGKFKDVINRAGSTIFVKPEEMRGTLKKGFTFYQQLSPGTHRAIFMMFLISEIHPFVDGNGRVARILMNAELENRSLSRIIIPTVYREDYLLALRKLSRKQDPVPYVRMLAKAHAFTASLDFSDYHKALSALQASNAFKEPSEGKLIY